MTELRNHQTNAVNKAIQIYEHALGNYVVTTTNRYMSTNGDADEEIRKLADLTFHTGELDGTAARGVTIEALLAIVEHRLEYHQSGEFKCRDGALALTRVQEAMMWLQRRTHGRQLRGVEGTQQV